MANLDFYKKNLNLSTIDEISNYLCGTLIETSSTYDFFVNWAKATKNRDTFRYETALLKSLKNSTNPISDFQNLLTKYPEVIKAIPILLACRDGILKVLESIETGLRHQIFDFSRRSYDNQEIANIVKFTEETGLLKMLCQMDSASDYLLGVEVGLDTNARKNRSGFFLEKMVTETLAGLSVRHPELNFVGQKYFKYIEKTYNIPIPASLRNRKFDFAVIHNGQPTTIEVNYYSGSGSKPSEIISSYINRGEVLAAAGWKFVWLTDGIGWKKMRNPLRIGLENIEFVINSHLLRNGFFEKILLSSE